MGDEKIPSIERTGNLPNAEYRRFEGVRQYEELIDELIPQAQRVIRVFDKTLSRTWDSPQRNEALRQFLLTNRVNRLCIVMHDAEPIGRECPRVMARVGRFGPPVRTHQTLTRAKHVYAPFVVFDASHYVHRFH